MSALCAKSRRTNHPILILFIKSTIIFYSYLKYPFAQFTRSSFFVYRCLSNGFNVLVTRSQWTNYFTWLHRCTAHKTQHTKNWDVAWPSLLLLQQTEGGGFITSSSFFSFSHSLAHSSASNSRPNAITNTQYVRKSIFSIFLSLQFLVINQYSLILLCSLFICLLFCEITWCILTEPENCVLTL